MNFGPETDEADSHAIMDRAHEHGINFFDTANVYGWGENRGRTEQIVGTLVRPGRRPPRPDGASPPSSTARWATGPTTTSCPRCNIRRACEASLRRLQTDHIDLYQMHHVDRDTPWDEIWQAMDVLVAAGQDPLRRLVQLRRLAHRPGQRGAPPAGTRRAGQRAVDLQPAHPRGRARGAAGRARRTGSASSRGARCTAACSAACCARSGRASRRLQRPGQGGAGGAPRADRARTRTCATELGEEPADVGAGLAAHPARR